MTWIIVFFFPSDLDVASDFSLLVLLYWPEPHWVQTIVFDIDLLQFPELLNLPFLISPCLCFACLNVFLEVPFFYFESAS